MEKRQLGKTGLEVSLLGFGGYHLVEIPTKEARELLNYYLDQGGNYLETASEYGDGESERKLGPVVAERRDEIVLASKSYYREKEKANADLERTLTNLQTNYLDVWFMHHVEDMEQLEKIFSPGGAMEAAREAKEAGKIKNIGISMHGQPDVLIEALKRDAFDVVMATFNYFDRCNFPKLEGELLSLAQEKDVGVVLMKPLADGFLWRSAEQAFRYSFSLPVSVVVTGMNTMDMLQTDLDYANNYKPMSEKDVENLLENASELGNYICRQCDQCFTCPDGTEIKEIFKLEGYYDRQLWDGKPRNPEKYALRDRIRFWFGNDDKAKSLYKELNVDIEMSIQAVEGKDFCPYNLPIVEKLKIAHYKLGEDDSLF